MHSWTTGQTHVLPSNSENDSTARTEPDSDREAFADLTIGVAVLALLATGLTVIGYHFGGPLPRVGFWRTFGPLLLVPLAILLGVILTPGGLLVDEATTLVRRVGFALAGLGLFTLVVAVLNAPSVLVLGH
jgi:hypothetical protein